MFLFVVLTSTQPAVCRHQQHVATSNKSPTEWGGNSIIFAQGSWCANLVCVECRESLDDEEGFKGITVRSDENFNEP